MLGYDWVENSARRGVMNGFTIRQDIRYAVRLLGRNPLFTVAATASLALAIGVTVAIFTLLNTILLRSLPVPNPDELVVLARNPANPTVAASYPDYCYLRDHSSSYTGLFAFWSGGVAGFNVPGENRPPQLAALALVSGNYFEVLGVGPELGRMFNSDDDRSPGPHPYVVLSHSFWVRVFGSDKAIVGRDLLLNGKPLRVVGVARDGFTGT